MQKGIKYEEEITIETTLSEEELLKILNDNGFKLNEKYKIHDVYLVKDNINIKDTNVLEILKNSILVRNIITDKKNIKQILYKYKKYNDKEEIIKQGKVKCDVLNLDEAENLLKHIGFKELVIIDDDLSVYSNAKDEMVVEKVNDRIYIEMETKCEYLNKTYSGIEEMKKVISEYKIPIKNNNYFAKKAEDMIREKYNILK